MFYVYLSPPICLPLILYLSFSNAHTHTAIPHHHEKVAFPHTASLATGNRNTPRIRNIHNWTESWIGNTLKLYHFARIRFKMRKIQKYLWGFQCRKWIKCCVFQHRRCLCQHVKSDTRTMKCNTFSYYRFITESIRYYIVQTNDGMDRGRYGSYTKYTKNTVIFGNEIGLAFGLLCRGVCR